MRFSIAFFFKIGGFAINFKSTLISFGNIVWTGFNPNFKIKFNPARSLPHVKMSAANADAPAKPVRLVNITTNNGTGEVVTVELPLLRQSVTIENMVKDLCMEEQDENQPEQPPVSIDLDITAPVLAKVVEWCKEHKGE